MRRIVLFYFFISADQLRIEAAAPEGCDRSIEMPLGTLRDEKAFLELFFTLREQASNLTILNDLLQFHYLVLERFSDQLGIERTTKTSLIDKLDKI